MSMAACEICSCCHGVGPASERHAAPEVCSLLKKAEAGLMSQINYPKIGEVISKCALSDQLICLILNGQCL